VSEKERERKSGKKRGETGEERLEQASQNVAQHNDNHGSSQFTLRSDQRSPSSQLNYLKHIAINFKLPNKAVLKTLQSSIKIIYIKHRYNFFNQHLAQ